MTLPSLRARRGLWILPAICFAQTACASFPVLGSSRADQLTAALTDVREGTPVAVALETVRLAPFRIPEGGSGEPLVEPDGRHATDWLEATLASGLADRLCEDPDACTPSPGLTVVALSRPYAGRRGAFVDARVKGARDTGAGIIRYTRFIRLQMEDEESGWRVVASTPLWETMG